MNSLFEKIKKVPAISLSVDEWRVLSDIVSSLQNKKNDAFAGDIKQENIDFSQQIIEFVNEGCWHKTVSWAIPDPNATLIDGIKAKLDELREDPSPALVEDIKTRINKITLPTAKDKLIDEMKVKVDKLLSNPNAELVQEIKTELDKFKIILSPETKAHLDNVMAECYKEYQMKLQAKLETTFNFSPEKTLAILNFLEAWEEAADALLFCYQYLCKIWFKVYKDNVMGGDETLALLCELLPGDKIPLLTEAQQQLQLIASLATNGRTDMVLTNLRGAITCKIGKIEIEDPAEREKIRKVVVLVYLQDVNDKLILFTKGYLDDLLKHFFTTLKAKDLELYNRYFAEDKKAFAGETTPEEMIEILISEIIKKNVAIHDTELNSLFAKYDALKDIHITLAKDASCNNKLFEFTKKFELYNELLSTSLHEGFFTSIGRGVTQLFKEQSNKDKFLAFAKKVCKEELIIDPVILEEMQKFAKPGCAS